MRCQQCGRECDEETTCPDCSSAMNSDRGETSVIPPPPMPALHQQRKPRRRWLVVLIVMLVCALILMTVRRGISNYQYARSIGAIENGDLATVQYFIHHGLDVNARGGSKSTLLHAAAYNGQTEIVEALIKEGAEMNPLNAYGQTPLIVARKKIGKTDPAHVLLAHGANPNILDYKEFSALWMAYSNRYTDEFNDLLDHGADPNWSHKGLTILMAAAYEDRPEIVRSLLLHHADPNMLIPPKNRTALSIAMQWKRYSIASQLLHAGARR